MPDDEQELSGLVVSIPEAEAVVGPHRDRLDPSARLGVPAHVTVLFPFLPPDEVTDGVLDRLGGLFGSVAPFDVELVGAAWFGEEVLWLAPRDPAPWRHLTELVHGAFPDHPPFEGAFEEVVPHLTVSDRHDVELARDAERAIAPQLPVRARVERVQLLVQHRPGTPWEVLAELPLGRASGQVRRLR